MKKSLNTAVAKAIALFDSGKRKEAIDQVSLLCRKNTRVKQLKILLAQMACNAHPDIPANPRFIKELANCLDEQIGDARRLLQVAGTALNQDKKLVHGITLLGMGNLESNCQALQSGQLEPVFGNILLQSMLRNALLTNSKYDLAMSQLRRFLLLSVSTGNCNFDFNKNAYKKFCSSLALQCLLNEHVYYCDDDEHVQLKQLQADVEARLSIARTLDFRTEIALLVLAMYQPLHELDIKPEQWETSNIKWPATLIHLVKEINAHFQEIGIKEKIETLMPIDNEISVAVQEHYEANPYPRWISLPNREQTSFFQWIVANLPHFKPPKLFKQPIRLLVAGCGTGLEVLSAAATWDTEHVLAIDLSKSSLAYAIRKSEELGLADRIDFKQADILRLHDLPEPYRDFHVITSSGVLHHLKDPVAGFRILLDLLCPGGIMRFALYSELARRFVVKARKYIADNRLNATPNSIRQFRHEILLLRHPELNALCENSDMYSLSACRDLLFHTQETRYNIGEIKHLLDELQLQFIGFEGIVDSKQVYRRMFPDDPSMINLDNWAAFEEKHPDTFESMYAIIAQKQ